MPTDAAAAPVLRAATYGRQSKMREDESAGSPAAQREQTLAFVKARGWQHAGHYEDVGASGYDPKAERPGLDALLAAVRRGEVDLLVVYRLDRLTRRGVVEAVRLVGELADHGAALASVSEPFLDTSTPMGRGIFALFAAMAEQESSNISQRTKTTKDLLRRAGAFHGGQRPMGYVMDKEFRDGLMLTVLRPEPTEAAVVREVASRVLNGASVAGEARRLNREGIRTVTGKEWATSTLSRLLKSPTIAGYLASERSGIVRDDAGQPIAAWEPLVQPADWYRLQEVLAARSGGRGPRSEPTLLGGFDLFRCASCGGRMAGDRRTDGRGTYRCARHRRGSALCAGAAVAMAHTDAHLAEVVWDRVINLDPSESPDRELLQAVAKRYSTRTADPEVEAAARMARAVIADAEAALAQLDDDRAAGVFAGESGTERYRRQALALAERADAARAALQALPMTAIGDDMDDLTEVLTTLRYEGLDHRDMGHPWRGWTIEEKRDFLALFLAEVTVVKGHGHSGGNQTKWRGA